MGFQQHSPLVAGCGNEMGLFQEKDSRHWRKFPPGCCLLSRFLFSFFLFFIRHKNERPDNDCDSLVFEGSSGGTPAGGRKSPEEKPKMIFFFVCKTYRALASCKVDGKYIL